MNTQKKITITPKANIENPKITITPKVLAPNKGDIQTVLETDMVIPKIKDNSSFIHYRQNTPANCGPLSVINGINALKFYHPNFNIPEGFPQTARGIRALLGDNALLRNTHLGLIDSDEIKQSSTLLRGDHIFNLVNEITKNSNLQIIGDRFHPIKSKLGFPNDKTGDMVECSDRIITCGNNHFISYVRVSKDIFKCIDSMALIPYDITTTSLKTNIPFSFMAMQLS